MSFKTTFEFHPSGNIFIIFSQSRYFFRNPARAEVGGYCDGADRCVSSGCNGTWCLGYCSLGHVEAAKKEDPCDVGVSSFSKAKQDTECAAQGACTAACNGTWCLYDKAPVYGGMALLGSSAPRPSTASPSPSPLTRPSTETSPSPSPLTRPTGSPSPLPSPTLLAAVGRHELRQRPFCCVSGDGYADAADKCGSCRASAQAFGAAGPSTGPAVSSGDLCGYEDMCHTRMCNGTWCDGAASSAPAWPAASPAAPPASAEEGGGEAGVPAAGAAGDGTAAPASDPAEPGVGHVESASQGFCCMSAQGPGYLFASDKCGSCYASAKAAAMSSSVYYY